MSAPTPRKRDQFRQFLGLRPSSSSSKPGSNRTSPVPSLHASGTSTQILAPESATTIWNKHRLEIINSTRTVLNIVEKGLDGLPIYGPKAVVATTSEILKVVQVEVENEQAIEEIIKQIEVTQAELTQRYLGASALLASASADITDRIAKFNTEIATLKLRSEENSKSQRNLIRRILDAEHVAKELSGVGNVLSDAHRRFMMNAVLSTEIKVELARDDVGTLTALEMERRDNDNLDRLRPVTSASYNASGAAPPCLPGTRTKLLEDIKTWIDDTDPSSKSVFWLNGMAGTGKTAVARSVADWAAETGRLAGSFFFSRASENRREPAAIIPTIAYQLAQYHQALKGIICQSVLSDRDIRDREVGEQARSLLGPLSRVVLHLDSPCVIVLDALDESHRLDGKEGGEAIPKLVEMLLAFSFSCKVFITGRAEETLRRMFDLINPTRLSIHEIEDSIVSDDIRVYLEHHFAILRENRGLADGFPPAEALKTLQDRAHNLFIYAFTAIQYISDDNDEPHIRLAYLLERAPDESSSQHRQLDVMYMQILDQAAKSTSNQAKHLRNLNIIVGLLVVLQDLLPVSAFAHFAACDPVRVWPILRRLSAILVAENDKPIRLFHPSFPDFIIDRERCIDERFYVIPTAVHGTLATRSLIIINGQLHSDHRVDIALVSPDQVSQWPKILANTDQQTVPDHVRYACIFWCTHLCASGAVSEEQIELLHTFCLGHVLQWLKVIFVLKALGAIHEKLPSLIDFLQHRKELGSADPRVGIIHSTLDNIRQALNGYFWSTRTQHTALAVPTAVVDDLFSYAIKQSRLAQKQKSRLQIPSKFQVGKYGPVAD